MTMLDGNSAAELARDKDEMPESIRKRASEELTEEAINALTFDKILEAMESIPEGRKSKTVKALQKESTVMICVNRKTIVNYITPLNWEVSLRAAEILAEMDDRKGTAI